MTQAAISTDADKSSAVDISTIADGDIVEVVLRGPVSFVRSYGFTLGAGSDPPAANTIFPDAGHVVSITKVEPPYEPQHGDIVRDARGNLFGRGSSGWRITPGTDIFGQRQPVVPLTLLVRDGQVVSS
jgi:hypothetical protein